MPTRENPPLFLLPSCLFWAEAPGHHRRTTWSANREQIHLHFDVQLRPRAQPPADPIVRGAEEPSVTLAVVGDPVRSWTAGSALVELSYRARVEPAADRPRGALARARVLCPYGAGPRGPLARVDRVLTGWVEPYPRGGYPRPSLPTDAAKLKKAVKKAH